MGPFASIRGRDVVRVAGPDAVTFLQGQLSQDVAAIAPGASAWSLLLQPQGKVEAWVRLHRLTADAVLVEGDAGWGPAGLTRLRADLASGQWAARYRDLLTLEALDIGHRLVVCEIANQQQGLPDQ